MSLLFPSTIAWWTSVSHALLNEANQFTSSQINFQTNKHLRPLDSSPASWCGSTIAYTKQQRKINIRERIHLHFKRNSTCLDGRIEEWERDSRVVTFFHAFVRRCYAAAVARFSFRGNSKSAASPPAILRDRQHTENCVWRILNSCSAFTSHSN